MEFSDVAMVTIGKFTGECDIYFEDTEHRFRIVRKPSSSGTGTVVRVMFGMIGQAIMNSVGEGEELASFTPADIRNVEAEEKKRKSILTLYPYSGDGPYIITIGNKKELSAHLHRELMENRYQAASQEPMLRTEIPPQLLDTPPVEPMEPVAPIQPAPMTSVPPMPPVAPAPAVQQPAPMTAVPVQQPAQYSVQQPVQPQMQQPVQQPVPPVAPGGNALLCLRSGPLAGRVYPIPMGAVLVIGRSPARSNLALPQYDKVSSAHCRVEIGNRCLRVSDLNSTNGTFANGAPLNPGQPVILREGDTLMLANESCLFRIAFE